MSLKDMMKSFASTAAEQAQEIAVQKVSEAQQASSAKKEKKAEEKKEAKQRKEEEKALKKSLGRLVDVILGEGGTRLTLYENGVEFFSPDSDLNPGMRRFEDISSISIEDGEALQSRVTATRILLTGVFALALKKKTGGTKFVTVEGDGFFWPIEVGRKQAADAQKIVMKAKAMMAKHR